MAKAKKFNVFGGVFTPSILTLLGVIMYLRLPWIVGQAGLIATLGIILVAHIVSGSTGLSVASIATDKRVETGGTYYIISRSLGLPIGGTLGWALFAGLSLSVSLYLIGFAEVFLSYFGFEVTLNTIRLAGSVILLIITILTFISTSLTIKTQYIILTIMVLSLVSVFFGRHDFTPVAPQIESLPSSLPWITLFAIFFPAVTGFEAGVSMSGDLKDPRRSIPVGTISAILVALIVYVGLAVFLSYTVSSDLLVNDTNILFKIAWIPQLVIAGVLGATLSSALGSILGAPRIMQAVARDRIAPSFLGKGFGPSNEPRNALIFSFIIAQVGILIGELNVIARVVTIFFIITYGFINITYAVESWASSDFRPSFKIPRIVSIIGAVACIILMIQLDIMALAAASLILLSLFFYLKNKELTLNSGDTRSSIWRSLVKMGLKNLTNREINNRNWRPNIILFSGGAQKRPHLVEFGMALVGKQGIFTNFELVENESVDSNLSIKADNPLLDQTAVITLEEFGDVKNIITRRHICKNIYDGISVISSVYGFSGFEPNTILMGWPKNIPDPNKFETLLESLKRLDYNLTFLNYNKERKFGNHKRIDFWWSGKGNTLPLALHLIRFITSNTSWRRAEVRVLAINNSSRNTDRFQSVLSKITDSYRIDVQIKVIGNIDKLTEREIIRSESHDTCLTIVEIPDFNTTNAKADISSSTSEIVNYVNTISSEIGTSLFIRSASSFEDVSLIPQTNPVRDELIFSDLTNKDSSSISKCVHLSDTDVVRETICNLSKAIELPFNKFKEDTISAIGAERSIFLDQLEMDIKGVDERLLKILTISDKAIRERESYLLLKDFASHSQSFINEYKEKSLKGEQEILLKGVDEFISKIFKTAGSLPKVIKIMYSREDFRKLRPATFYKKINKYLKLLWLGTFKTKASLSVGLHPAADYFITNRSLKSIEFFYDNFTLQSITSFSEIREILTSYHTTIERYCKREISKSDLLADKKRVSAQFRELKSGNSKFFSNQSDIIFNELVSDIGEFSKLIDNPQANLLSRRYRAIVKSNIKLRARLSEFPDSWGGFMEIFTNRTAVDFICLNLKDRLAHLIHESLSEIQRRVDNSVVSYINEFRTIIESVGDIERYKDEKRVTDIQRELRAPVLDDLFSSLLREIDEAISELPEKIIITGNDLPKGIDFENDSNIVEIEVNIRRLASYYISSELGEKIKIHSEDTIESIFHSVDSIKNMIKLANFSLSNFDPDKDSADSMVAAFLDNIEVESGRLMVLSDNLRERLGSGLKSAFEPLTSAVINRASANLNRRKRAGERSKLTGYMNKHLKSAGKHIVNQFVKLLYRQSEGLLWAKRMEQRSEMIPLLSQNGTINPAERAARRSAIENLPYYYHNLFSGNSGIGEDFWVGMEEECERGGAAISRFMNGERGILIITGERRSGKSTLSRHLARAHFDKDRVYTVRAPQQSCSDLSVFENQLVKLLGGRERLLDEALDGLSGKSVIIINDLELWWERREGGTAVVERIIDLMKRYGDRVLFIVNVNKYALKIINKITSINTWLLDIILCQPFSARDLKEFIMLRHKAGGLKFVYKSRREEDMTNWEFASLFNKIFNLSSGNPGYAISLWLNCISEVKEGTIYLNKPTGYNSSALENLTDEHTLFLLQFILHRRFSALHLAATLRRDEASVSVVLQSLLNKDLLTEKYPGVFSLNKMVEPMLVKQFKSLELI